MQVSKSSIEVRNCPILNENITTQMLFGEQFKILKYQNNWVYGYSIIDNYYGWIEKKNLSHSFDYTHLIAISRAIVLIAPDVKSSFITYLPLRSRIKVISINNNWAKIKLCSDFENRYGYVSNFQVLEKNKYIKNWVKYAEPFLGTPYRWGGRDSFGIDCSALVQLSMAFSGVLLPRDSYDQYLFFKNNRNYVLKHNIQDIKLLVRGNIVYWPGHIGIMITKNKIIHASGYHSLVVIENILKVIERVNERPLFIFQD